MGRTGRVDASRGSTLVVGLLSLPLRRHEGGDVDGPIRPGGQGGLGPCHTVDRGNGAHEGRWPRTHSGRGPGAVAPVLSRRGPTRLLLRVAPGPPPHDTTGHPVAHATAEEVGATGAADGPRPDAPPVQDLTVEEDAVPSSICETRNLDSRQWTVPGLTGRDSSRTLSSDVRDASHLRTTTGRSLTVGRHG